VVLKSLLGNKRDWNQRSITQMTSDPDFADVSSDPVNVILDPCEETIFQVPF